MTERLTPAPIPKPFLHRPFPAGAEPIIATGFRYSPSEIALHGTSLHEAIDFDMPRGTPVLAAADGWALASYGEGQVFNPDGTPHMLDRATILANTPDYARDNLHLPDHDGDGPWPVWFGAYTVQIKHGNGCYTQYAHLDWVDEAIPYYPPYKLALENQSSWSNHAGAPNSSDFALHHSDNLRLPVREYRPPIAERVKAGQQIGVSGMTGAGIMERCWNSSLVSPLKGRPDWRGRNYFYYNAPHLHFAVFSARVPRSRKPKKMFDPFGQYGGLVDEYGKPNYPPSTNQWASWQPHRLNPPHIHRSLWLP